MLALAVMPSDWVAPVTISLAALQLWQCTVGMCHRVESILSFSMSYRRSLINVSTVAPQREGSRLMASACVPQIISNPPLLCQWLLYWSVLVQLVKYKTVGKFLFWRRYFCMSWLHFSQAMSVLHKFWKIGCGSMFLWFFINHYL